MSSLQYQEFISIVHLLVEADKKIDAFEFVVRQFIKRQYDRVCRKTVSQSSISSAKILPEIVVLLSVLARQGIADNEAGAANAFRKGINSFELTAGLSPSTSSILPQDSGMFSALDKAVGILSTVPYKQKNAIMGACVQCVLSDELVTIEEFELLRALGEMMGVPIPPYVEVN
jgi:hypothetical protein